MFQAIRVCLHKKRCPIRYTHLFFHLFHFVSIVCHAEVWTHESTQALSANIHFNFTLITKYKMKCFHTGDMNSPVMPLAESISPCAPVVVHELDSNHFEILSPSLKYFLRYSCHASFKASDPRIVDIVRFRCCRCVVQWVENCDFIYIHFPYIQNPSILYLCWEI
jgi:hypothetical protein